MRVTDQPILVTGVTGFIGAEITRQLLETGYRVRGTTRDVGSAREEGHVTGLPGADERLDLVEADMMDPQSVAATLDDCEYVMHVASPYALEVDDPQADLVDPAVQGVTSVLEAAQGSDAVKRIVLTSSFVAMMGKDPDGHVFTEADWNERDSVDFNPYPYSKTVAERTAWAFMDERDPAFDLVVINPAQVIGPTLVPRVNQSHEWFVGLTDGSQPAIIGLDFPTVDVRDVAALHIRAMADPDASGRYLTSSENMTHRQVAEIGREVGMADRYRFPRMMLDQSFGIGLSKLALRFQPKGTRDYLLGVVGKRFAADNSKARALLGRDFITIDKSIADTWMDLDRWGLLGR